MEMHNLSAGIPHLCDVRAGWTRHWGGETTNSQGALTIYSLDMFYDESTKLRDVFKTDKTLQTYK